LETAAKLLELLEPVLTIFSKCALKSLNNQAEWIAAILAREKVDATPEAKDHLWSALSSLASAPVGERTLTGLSVLLQSQSLKRALQSYCLGGPFGRRLSFAKGAGA
jgi:type IV secretory pathway VirB4 component